MNSEKLNGRAVLVTGANRGLGRAPVEEAADNWRGGAVKALERQNAALVVPLRDKS